MYDKLERVYFGLFFNVRNVFVCVNVCFGCYVIILFMFELGCYGKFIFRIYSSKGLNFWYDEIV